MRLKLCLCLSGWLLASLVACGSNNSSNPPTGSVTTTTETHSNQSSAAPPTVANTAAPGVPEGSPQPTTQTAATKAIDACSLIENQEVAKVQGSAIKEAKSNRRDDGQFLMSQCFYTAEEFVRSVNLTVFQPNPAATSKQPKDYFAEKFRNAGSKSKSEREREREKAKERKEKSAGQEKEERGEEEEEEKAESEPISGLGDQAFWVKSGPTASLYVLKNNQFIIISLGGGDAEPVKLGKTKELAKQALKRLK